jgi:hypothetical protein
MQYLRAHIKQLLKEGIIEPSSSNYSSPMFLVPKSGGEYRAVVDFCGLNKRTAVESVPLPDIQSAFQWFSKAKYFTTLDVNQAYHQIPLVKDSKALTAFCTDWNLYQYTRVPLRSGDWCPSVNTTTGSGISGPEVQFCVSLFG